MLKHCVAFLLKLQIEDPNVSITTFLMVVPIPMTIVLKGLIFV